MQPSESIVFLHITDLHFSKSGTSLGNQDLKDPLKDIPRYIKEKAFQDTLIGCLNNFGEKKISAILLTGDYDCQGPSGGMVQLRNILKDVFHDKEMPPIVVVPGNHDILKGSDPSSRGRYKSFVDCWRNPTIDHKTPFFERGVDNDIDANWEKHCLINNEEK